MVATVLTMVVTVVTVGETVVTVVVTVVTVMMALKRTTPVPGMVIPTNFRIGRKRTGRRLNGGPVVREITVALTTVGRVPVGLVVTVVTVVVTVVTVVVTVLAAGKVTVRVTVVTVCHQHHRDHLQFLDLNQHRSILELYQ